MKNYIFILIIVGIVSCQETYKKYYPNGELRKEIEIDSDSLPHGYCRIYRINGTIESEANFIHGKMNGKRIFYYPSEVISEIKLYKDDALVDSIVEFYESGQIKTISSIKNGEVTGKYKEFYETGELLFESKLLNYQHHGQGFSYLKDGRIKRWTYHDKDSLISFVLFDEKNPKIIQKENRVVTVENNLKDNKCALGDTIKLNFGLLGPVLEKDKATLKNYYTYFEARKWKLCLEEGKVSKNNLTYINWVPDSVGFYEVRVYTEYKGKVYSKISNTIYVGNPKPFNDVPFEYPKDKCRFIYDSNSNKIIKAEDIQ